ncbi:hypothetical protein B2G71_14190 [Novosphingobium sp. PC22D]|uniref:Ig-like domain-containing protein n=1 Tax=Novosphingobium sp. PC22D TaxID=1962403 RepID=UPI000BF178F1|nr:Ig-like domain-containing protein [Novosphingobium sp. PC22D]PEQ11931.1 hypothetical protein B2G71_14190 [Novosphingobium sp. PC22D]
MAIIVRITSADGKKVITKELPALPANLKVPAGARVDVKDSDTGERMSLGQYINEHADDERRAEDGQIVNDKVTIETVQDWAAAEQWLNSYADGTPPVTQTGAGDSMGTTGTVGGADPWYSTDSNRNDDSVLGYDKNTLTLGAIVGGGLAVGAFAVASAGGGDDNKDTVAPVAPSALNLATEDDTGDSTTDNVTSKSEGLTITGTAEAGATVELFEGSTSLGETTASSSGTFTFEIDLAEGAHDLIAVATDNAGNVSQASTKLTVTIDTTGPAPIDALNFASGDDTGESGSDRITFKTEDLTITGIGPANTIVKLYEGTLLLGTDKTDANGLFNIDLDLDEGVHNIYAIATDVAGNDADPSPSITITVDTTVPLPVTQLDLAPEDDTGSSNSDNITAKTNNLTITGVAEAGATIELFDISSKIGTVVAGEDGTFSLDVNLGLGDHQITANVTDIAGNTTNGTSALEISVVEPGADVLSSLLGSTTTFG